MLALAKVYL